MHPLNVLVLLTLAGQAWSAAPDLARLCERRSRSLHYLMTIRLCDRYRGGVSSPAVTSSRERDLVPTTTPVPDKLSSDEEKEEVKDDKERNNDGYLRFGRSVKDPSEKKDDNKEDAKRYMRFGRAYMRFGKRNNDYMRFGSERAADDDQVENDKRYMRFGRGDEEVDENALQTGMDNTDQDDKKYMRFGRGGDAEKRYMRFGRSDAADADKRYMRFGRSDQDEKRYMRFGKRYMRFGRSDQQDAEKRYMRFGRSKDDEKRYMRFGRANSDDTKEEDKRYMRFGKRSKRSVDQEEEDPLERLQRLLRERSSAGGYLRFGRSGNTDNSPDAEKRYMRFGRGDYMRFGRLTDEDEDSDLNKRYMRFGRFMRFGKNINAVPYMRASRDNGLMRLSRQLAERDPAGYLRFGKK